MARGKRCESQAVASAAISPEPSSSCRELDGGLLTDRWECVPVVLILSAGATSLELAGLFSQLRSVYFLAQHLSVILKGHLPRNNEQPEAEAAATRLQREMRKTQLAGRREPSSHQQSFLKESRWQLDVPLQHRRDPGVQVVSLLSSWQRKAMLAEH
ncbi:unnamed protein product [Pleuronectes platessa]|uniref:Uncharacterized protein n=1 Tax=Pleuronectes platessa TaxID=8262 RepID=A0A9N7VX73_PLEPL|nr:unnamed protein product [Pleuronectes platessa]